MPSGQKQQSMEKTLRPRWSLGGASRKSSSSLLSEQLESSLWEVKQTKRQTDQSATSRHPTLTPTTPTSQECLCAHLWHDGLIGSQEGPTSFLEDHTHIWLLRGVAFVERSWACDSEQHLKDFFQSNCTSLIITSPKMCYLCRLQSSKRKNVQHILECVKVKTLANAEPCRVQCPLKI